MPTRPCSSRNKIKSSPNQRTSFGKSDLVSCEKPTGSQYLRKVSPAGVPGPTRVSVSFSLASMSFPLRQFANPTSEHLLSRFFFFLCCSALEVLLKELERAGPCLLRRLRMVALALVAVESVVRARIDLIRVGFFVSFHRLHGFGDTFVDSRVQLAVVCENRRFDV